MLDAVAEASRVFNDMLASNDENQDDDDEGKDDEIPLLQPIGGDNPSILERKTGATRIHSNGAKSAAAVTSETQSGTKSAKSGTEPEGVATAASDSSTADDKDSSGLISLQPFERLAIASAGPDAEPLSTSTTSSSSSSSSSSAPVAVLVGAMSHSHAASNDDSLHGTVELLVEALGVSPAAAMQALSVTAGGECGRLPSTSVQSISEGDLRPLTVQ